VTVSRIPKLGPNGEGWVFGQLVLLLAEALTGAFALTNVALDSSLRVGALVAGALLILIWAFVFLRGLRDLGTSITAVPRPKADAVLVEAGISRRMRHPIYAGMILSSLGWSLFAWSWIAFLLSIGLAAWLDLKARLEERWLVMRYPDYREYQARSYRFLPGIY
jgi:protein-S-isoprenylcysteine O-methyltransferase Ste14